MKRLMVLFLLGLFSTETLACTPGAGNGPTGDPNCMGGILNTDPYYNGGQQNTPPSKVIRHITVDVPSKYGALAFNPKKGAIGGSINANSKAEAKLKAIKQCEQDGKYAPCQIIASVRNGCIAAVSGKSKSGTNKIFRAIEERGQTEKVALQQCQAAGYSGCSVVMPEGCSIPEGMYD